MSKATLADNSNVRAGFTTPPSNEPFQAYAFSRAKDARRVTRVCERFDVIRY